jgi:adenosylhomocysteine nucleosidase
VILFFYAFSREVAPFRRRLTAPRALEQPGLDGLRADLDGTEIVLVATGIGPARAHDAARLAFDAFPEVDLAVGTGVAGALSAGLRPGDLVLPDRIIARRDDRAGFEHVHAIEDGCVRALSQALSAAGLEFESGALLTSHRVLPTASEKRRAKDETGAIAVDMETAALAREAVRRGIPFACLRAILDAVGDELVRAKIDEQGRIGLLATAARLMRNPATLVKLLRMMRNLGRATRSLAGGLEAIARGGDSGDAPGARDRKPA